MFTIRQFPFDAGGQASSALAECGSNWPVIYLINSDSDIYVGETSSFERSFSEHLRSKRSKFPGFSEIRFAFDGTENESAVLDYESNLVRLYSADGLFSRVINANPGQSKDHDYYQRPTYHTKVQALWDQLHSLGLTKQNYRTVRNSSLYKFSPFTSLTSEQREVMHDMLEDFLEAISLGKKGGALVKGGAGTGKSLLAVKAIDMLLNVERYLSDWKKSPGAYGKEWRSLFAEMERYIESNGPFRIAYVAPQQSFNADMRKAFGKMPWTGGQDLVHNTSNIVTRYSDLEMFDIILVDETHRLKHRPGMGNDIGLFDENCRRLGLSADATQLDVILARTRYACLFYDPEQSVKISDITPSELDRSLGILDHPVLNRALRVQMRCLGGGDYERFIDGVLSGSAAPHPFGNYDFRVYDDVSAMVSDIRSLDRAYGLCRNVAGFAWPWRTKEYVKEHGDELAAIGGINHGRNAANLLGLGQYDIEIGNERFVWNIRSRGWVTSPGAADEIGCIHTSQGYDLNYCGVILGPDIRYKPDSGEVVIEESNFCDPFLRQNRKNISREDLRRYVINAYRTMLMRGIYGCFVYAVDDELRDYLKRCSGSLASVKEQPEPTTEIRKRVESGMITPADKDVPREENPGWFGKRVAQLRRRRGWSQEELAFRCGIHRSYMGVIERGEKSPSMDTVSKVAKGLGLTVGELFLDMSGQSHN